MRKHPNERDQASYVPDNYVPIETGAKLSLLEGDRAIAPGVELIRVPGHTANMQCVKLTRRREDGVLFRGPGADHGASDAAMDHGLRFVSR